MKTSSISELEAKKERARREKLADLQNQVCCVMKTWLPEDPFVIQWGCSCPVFFGLLGIDGMESTSKVKNYHDTNMTDKVKNYHDTNMTDEDVAVAEKLISPHGYAIFMALKARKAAE